MDCPACGHANHASASCCAGCGRGLTAGAATANGPCPDCGTARQPGAKFCPACGHALPDNTASDPLDFSGIHLDTPLPAGDDRTVILPASRPSPPSSATTSPAAAAASGPNADMTVILPAGWRQPAGADNAVRRASEEVTLIPLPPEPATAAAPPPLPPAGSSASPPPSTPASPASAASPTPITAAPATGNTGGKRLIGLAAVVLVAVIGSAAWYWLSPAATTPATPSTASAPPFSPAPPSASAAMPPGTDGAPAAIAGAPTLALTAEDVVAPPPPVTVQTASAGPRPVRELYRDTCARCHDRGEGGAPRVAAADEWNGLLKRPRNALAETLMQGHGGAPARGGVDLSTDEARGLVSHVTQLVERSSAARAAAERKRQAEAAAAPPPVAAPAPHAAPKADDWLTSLRGELARCGQLGFFARIPCEEKARWSHCNTRWNTVPECTLRNQQNAP